MRICKYMIQWKSSHRKESYGQIKKLFAASCREGAQDSDYIVTYGARTALDLYLQARDYPAGSEVLITAISTDGIIETLRGRHYPNRNELKVVPVDVQWETMGPTLLGVASLVTDKTRAVVLCYPYGIVYDISQIAAFCAERGIDVIEDATEAFSGLPTPGSPLANLTLLSFGMLRHCSSFGSAVSVVRRQKQVYRKMLELEKAYKVDSSIVYFTRVTKALRLMALLNSRNRFLDLARKVQQYQIVSYCRKPIWKLRQRISLP